MNQKITGTASTVAFLAIAAAMVVPIVQGPYGEAQWYKYLYAVGAGVMLICALFSPFKGTDLRLRRLTRLQSWSAIMFCTAAFFLFYNPDTYRDWVAFTLAGAVIRAYSNFAIVAHTRKNKSRG